MTRYLSVCSGVGGLDYGLERAGWQPVAMCESATYPRRILARHWPAVPCFTDLTTLRAVALPGPVDAIAGGIPCQPFSTAGKQVGTDDPRHLWPHFLRLMGETGAGLGLVENVRGLLTAQKGQAFATILREAVAAGFTVEWQILAAGTLGAPHIRQRVFLVLRRAGWTWPGVAQVGMFGSSPWAAIAPPSDGWPVSGRATASGWVQTPWAYPHSAVWPWEAVQGEMAPTPGAVPNAGSRNTPESAAHLGLSLTDWARGDGGRGRKMIHTPSAGMHNYDEDPEQWEARRLELAAKGTNGNGAGIPLGQWVHRMIRTPSVGDVVKAAVSTNQRSLDRDALQGLLPGGQRGKLRPAPVEWMMGWPAGWTRPVGESLKDAPPQTWTAWPACDWTTTEKEPHRRDRLKGCGNGVVGQVGERIGMDVLASVVRLRRTA